MPRFVEGVPRTQSTLFPERIEDYVDEENPVRAIDAFVDALDLEQLGFHGMNPKATGRPAYHPAIMLKLLYVYRYLNRSVLAFGSNRKPPSGHYRGRSQ